ncbi:MAG: PAS domain S-box protein [Methanothrix sp.]|jgi:PAS domain S-box-containing protein|uniref:histidine kinase n=1 Tax=Methanothrix harundinacea TaxID=301375 RepID=A0A124G3I6_9EURY|nr:MAG: PAS/PAC sensor signal transduction histidine kinase [Methanothrix harundinacea]MDD2637375.1 PAS domain S-box protein [Methanothrix sp.]MDD3708830.1 PAS domain S-box protein [Methanothrix sp.]MDD5768403.1 PAS domain S-box protein [Methanothrix sp.]MDI9399299.1 PAS domain S-box protein [Euryarchaeota archaeon]
MKIDTAGSGAEATDKLNASFYDVIVTDYSMDGIALLKTARSKDPEIPFILLIDFDEGAISEALKYGAEHCFKGRDRGVFFSDLDHRIRKAVEWRRERVLHQELDERHRALLQSLPAITFSSSLDFVPTSIRGKVEEITGYTKEEISSCNPSWGQIIHPDEFLWLRPKMDGARAGSLNISENEYRIVRKDGEVAWVHELVQIVCEGPGHSAKVEGVLYDITFRKRTEAALKDSESRYRELAGLLPLIAFELDLEGRVTFYNQKGLEVFGYSPEDLRRGLTIFDVIVNDDPDELEGGFRLALKGVCPDYELLMKRKDGSAFPTIIKTAPIIRDGHPSGLRGIIVDISERKEMEEALRESERFYRTIIEDQTDLICRFRPDGVITFANDAYYRYFGKTREELIGQTFMPLIPEEDQEMVRQKFSSLSRDSPLTSYEHRVVLPGGLVRWQRWTDRAIFDDSGELVEFQSVGQDITEKKKLDDELRRAHKRLMDIIGFLPDATFVVDEDRRVIAWNRAIEDMTGVRKEEIIGEGDYAYAEPFYGSKKPMLVDLIFSDDEDTASHYDRVIKTGKDIFGEVFAPTLYGGRGSHLWAVASPLFDDEGRVVGAIESIRDVTERKRAEKMLQRAHHELEARVAERTRELEAKNAEMERFVYTVSHDLRSPLVTIQGFLGFLKEDVRDRDVEKIDADIEMISDAVKNMDYLLQDTLRLSRIGRVANPPEAVPFGEIVRGALGLVSEMARSKGVEISTAEGWPILHVDRLRIREVLVNLIENGIRYSAGRPRPLVEVGWRKDDEETVFFVRDNGIGIDPGQQEKVFELFYKADPEGEGTGAGLAIVKRIIEVHGGRIWVESEEGEGSTFCFTLPVVD